MPAIVNLAAEFGAGIIANNSLATGVGPGFLFSSQSANGIVLGVGRATLGGASAPLMTLDLASAASGPVFQLLNQSFVSCTTIQFITGAVNGTGAIRVQYPDGITYGWIPVLPSGSVTAAAR